MTQAQRSNALHLSQMNLDQVLPEVFSMTNLIRLDLSFNNIVKLSAQIGDLTNLQQLWLNDNPLREVPVELSNCHKMRELDLKNTFVITLPREMANMASLLVLNLDGCPTKQSLTASYSAGMSSIHTELRRKEDRKVFKEHLFDHLTEWVYPSQPKELVFERIEELFMVLKDCNSDMLKKLHRNSQMLFPVRFEDINPMTIRTKLFALYDEGIAREDIGELQLRLKSHFLDEPLEDVVNLATDIFNTVEDKNVIDQFFKFKSHMFTAPFAQLTAQILLENLRNYKARKNQERRQKITQLYQRIDQLYADEKIKPEKLEEYTNGLVKELKLTSQIEAFSKVLAAYMPKYNELKHFNANRIVTTYQNASVEQRR